ncbi:MAG: ComEA family DNA-binding protein [Syntrophaceticus schinkii]|jgi:competence protein ComEA|nr:ComEA family DNA-binding protein [Syntrophaceticus schinkii]MDD4260933.1 ComEA family DNA-binding protein [Syntrophaceticus schinkii]
MWEMDRKAQVFLIIIAAALLFAGGYKYALFRAPGPESEVTVTEQVEETREMETLGVHVAGAVNKPGVYQLGQGARVEDAVSRADPLPDADLNHLNLARRVVDGEKIYVPREGEVQTSSDGSGVESTASAVESGGKININTASAAELDTLPGIGPVLAQRIIDYRTTHGQFRSVADLQKVSGIGSRRYEQLKDLITI